MEKEDKIVLTPGSKYRIISMEQREKPMITHGIFKGYTSIGNDEAICLELDESHKELKGRLRIIPCGMMLAIDVVEAAKEDKKDQPEGMYI
ncbi:MAG: hypothetical protein KAI64_00195 [Thermoplasmata archaeon]|nr:hypothetical protein [Thermoplasmata archaeon]